MGQRILIDISARSLGATGIDGTYSPDYLPCLIDIDKITMVFPSKAADPKMKRHVKARIHVEGVGFLNVKLTSEDLSNRILALIPEED